MNIRRRALAAVATLTVSALALSACATGEDFEETTSSASSAADSAANSASDATGTEAAGEDTVTVEDNYGTQVVPVDPSPLVVTDNRSFEILSDWDVKIDAAPKALIPFTVAEYKDNPDVIDIGNHREPDLEALTAVQPQVVINGQRFSQHYEAIAKLNPETTMVEFEPREGEPLDAELTRHAEALGQIFGEEEAADQLIADFEDALQRAKDAYDPEKKVMAVNVSGGEVGYIAPSVGRTFGPLFDLLELTPALEIEGGSDDHQGDDISVEAIAAANPDIIIVLDRDAGTSDRNEPGFTPAQTVIGDNAALKNTAAIADGNVYYAPEDTYTNESIITYTEILNALADQFEAAK